MPPHGPEAGDSATRRFTLPPLPFVGRDKELRGLGDMLKSVKRGSTSLAIITGESGVGKTALASHVATDATALGWQVATGTAYEMEVKSPYAIFADALSPLCTTLDGSSLAMATRGMEHELARIIPALATAADDFHLGPQVPLLPRVASLGSVMGHARNGPQARWRVDSHGRLTPIQPTTRR